MFSINDGWGTGEEQDILVSKLFDKPNSVDRINNNKKKKKQKNKGNINKQDADGSISKEPDQAKPKKNANGTNNSSENENLENKNNEENIENPGLKKKKNKKRKLSGDLETTNTSAALLKALDIEDEDLLEINAENTDTQTIKKKKKKKEKRKSEENNNILEHSITIKKTGIDETSVINNGLDFNEYDNLSGDKGTERDSKKKKKKSKKNRNKDNNSEQQTEKIDTETGNINSEEGDDAKDLSTDDQEKSPNIPESKSINSPKPNDAISKRLSKFQQKMNRKLEGGHFRYINEKLYTTDSHMAVDMFKRQPSLFDVYHKGFESQVLHWPENPVDLIIEFIKEQSEDSIVIDFGCGNAKIGRSVPQKVHSFDLVAVNDDVTVADMKNVPVKSGSADIAVFSLALMGTNVNDFIAEANRTLKISGHLKIAEVKSRFKDVQHFIDGVISHGFDLLSKDDTNKMFIMFDFEKTSNYNKNSKNDKTIELKPCIYKRR